MMTDKIKEMVIEQFGDADYFKECSQDIANHGASGGFNGFIYYNDTVPFGQRLRPYLKPILQDMADEFGHSSMWELLSTFGCLKDWTIDEIVDGWHGEDQDANTAVMNCLSWFALEEVAREYVDQLENEEVTE